MKKPFIQDCTQNAIYNWQNVLVILGTRQISLSNGTNNLDILHQKYFLNWQKVKTRFQSKSQILY